MRIGVVGMATWDTLLLAPEPTYSHDGVSMVDRSVTGVGGKGIVAAVAARLAGAEVVPCSMVGRRSTITSELAVLFKTGRYLLEVLDEDHRIWIVMSASDEVVTFVRAMAPDLDVRFEGHAAALVAEVDLLYVAMEHPRLLAPVVAAAAAAQLPVVSNLSIPLLAGRASLIPEIVRSSRTIICNAAEDATARAILGIESWADADAPLLVEVVVTEGGDGGRWTRAPFDAWNRYAAVAADPICVVGAGDTFNGQYLVSRYLEGRPIDEACAASAATAAEKVAYFGSSLPSRPRFERLPRPQ